MRAAGTENVGAIADPATPADLARITFEGTNAAAERTRIGDIVAAY